MGQLISAVVLGVMCLLIVIAVLDLAAEVEVRQHQRKQQQRR